MKNAYLHVERDGIIGVPMMGFGPDSSTLKKLVAEIISHLRNTVTIGRPLSETLNLLKSVFKQCSVENWDGYGALPVTSGAYLEARSFIEQLPSWLPKPDILGGPDGEIILEWYRNSRRLFAISITGGNKLIFAGLFGPNSRRGATYFGDSIPEEIINYIQKVE